MRNVLRISGVCLSVSLLSGCMLDSSARIERQRKADAERERQEQAEENLHRLEATCQGLERALDEARDENALDRQRLARLEQEVHDLKPAPKPPAHKTESHKASSNPPSKKKGGEKGAEKAGEVADLALVQAALKRAGFDPGPADGKMGAKTVKAIESFQQANGLAADGKVGPQTRAKLKPYLTEGGAEAGPEPAPGE